MTHPDVVSVDVEFEDIPGTAAAIGILIVLCDADALHRTAHTPHLCVYCVHLSEERFRGSSRYILHRTGGTQGVWRSV